MEKNKLSVGLQSSDSTASLKKSAVKRPTMKIDTDTCLPLLDERHRPTGHAAKDSSQEGQC